MSRTSLITILGVGTAAVVVAVIAAFANVFLGTGEKVQRIEASFAKQGEKPCTATVTLD